MPKMIDKIKSQPLFFTYIFLLFFLIAAAAISCSRSEYLLYRNNFGEWDLPFMNCPIR